MFRVLEFIAPILTIHPASSSLHNGGFRVKSLEREHPQNLLRNLFQLRSVAPLTFFVKVSEGKKKSLKSWVLLVHLLKVLPNDPEVVLKMDRWLFVIFLSVFQGAQALNEF